MKKHILVLGLKAFGMSIVKQLSKYDCQILAIDREMEKVEEADNYATHAICLDIHEADEMRTLELDTFDVAIITVDNIETSIMASLVFKENGIPTVIVKAKNETHKRILEKMGVDKIISPEEEMGVKLAKGIMNENVIDTINLSDEYSIVEINVKDNWIGKELQELDLRNTYDMNVLCVKNNSKKLQISPNLDYEIEEEDILVVIANNNKLDKIK